MFPHLFVISIVETVVCQKIYHIVKSFEFIVPNQLFFSPVLSI